MNVCSIYGTVFKTPLITRDEQNGEIVKCSYLLLTSDGDNSDMIPIHCYGKVAQFVAGVLKKGMRVAVTGKLKNVPIDEGYKLLVVALKNEFDDGRSNEFNLPLG